MISIGPIKIPHVTLLPFINAERMNANHAAFVLSSTQKCAKCGSTELTKIRDYTGPGIFLITCARRAPTSGADHCGWRVRFSTLIPEDLFDAPNM